MGVLFSQGGQWYVYEAAATVRATALREWIARGEGDHFTVKRWKAYQRLDPAQIAKLREAGLRFKGRQYDQYFGWSDKKIYCSELVWKMYKRAFDVELGKLTQLKCFDLTSSTVRKCMHDRYGISVPLDEPVISPRNIYDSDLLITVADGTRV